jgi:ribosomal protein S18 acetylase RimI-like enzyme
MRKTVTTYYLEMTSPADLRPGRNQGVELDVRQAKVPCPELNRFFYSAIGGDWYWIDKLPWTYEQWRAYVSRPELETWVGYHAGTPAGYFELEALPATGVEIAYFGLLPQFFGKGLGGALLTTTIEKAWQRKPARVWVHTCNLDHPSAMANYQARGFRLYKQESEEKELPDRPPGPWPGSKP